MHSSNTVHYARADAVPFVTGQLMRKYVNTRTFIKLRGIELDTGADCKYDKITNRQKDEYFVLVNRQN